MINSCAMLPERSSAVCLLFLSLVTVIPGGGAQYQLVREDPFAQGRESSLHKKNILLKVSS